MFGDLGGTSPYRPSPYDERNRPPFAHCSSASEDHPQEPALTLTQNELIKINLDEQ